MINFNIGISPCPNDTFIFEALYNAKIDTQDFKFNFFLEDVETLNQWALQEKLDISKISFGVLNKINHNYSLLNAGAALGNGVGPILIAKNDISLNQINNYTIGIPGENTTAHFLLNVAFPNITKKIFLPFHQIEDAILNNTIDAGVIIHENRFTYQQKNLIALMDLGNFWEEKNKLPIPLGGIVLHNTHFKYKQKIELLIYNSLVFANKNYSNIYPSFITDNAQSMDSITIQKHINLYVNEFSLSLGTKGLQAINTLLNTKL
ncbi:MAG: 1,4-dihydroxy-6-naphthoate synthase [Sediminibacterium sp.]|nr:1,4-dihydroxy-6-naphthoate synthase [Sediminibacterium sp.]